MEGCCLREKRNGDQKLMCPCRERTRFEELADKIRSRIPSWKQWRKKENPDKTRDAVLKIMLRAQKQPRDMQKKNELIPISVRKNDLGKKADFFQDRKAKLALWKLMEKTWVADPRQGPKQLKQLGKGVQGTAWLMKFHDFHFVAQEGSIDLRVHGHGFMNTVIFWKVDPSAARHSETAIEAASLVL
ncbi:hypothetical protein HDV00_001845, partial [Rhizophlyctis rosea]